METHTNQTTNTILIVDDNPIGRQALEALLDERGFKLVFAENGVQALEVAGEILPDVILLDVMMPGMDGYEVCRRLRETKRLAEVPVLMVTALDDQESKIKGIEAGADDFISKPFNWAELRARVRTITRLNRYRKLLIEREHLEQAHQELQEAYGATIEGWARALELRDQETEGHSQRVTALTLRISSAMGIQDDEMQHISRGALLHDIGKMGIPDSILFKPGPLSYDEWVVMRKHPTYAYNLLSPVSYLQPSLDIPHYHHERWDGSGYPQGLEGEEIPLAARIFAVVDIWDALHSDRPYRGPMPTDQVIEIIKKSSGSHLDPNVVEIFLNMIGSDRL